MALTLAAVPWPPAQAAAAASPRAAQGRDAQGQAARKPGECPSERADAVSAAVAARLCGGRVEIADRRTETTQVFANPDGTVTQEQSLAPVRVKRGDAWVPVDLTLQRQADGTVAPKAHPRGLRLSGGTIGPGEHEVVWLGEGDTRTSVSWTGPLPDPVLSGRVATYPDVMPGVDLVLEAHATGYQQYFVAKDRAALSRVRELSLPIRTGRLTAAPDGMGGMVFKDKSGETVSRAQTPAMWDAEVSPQTLEHRNRGQVGLTTVPRGAGRATMTLTPDAAFLDRADLRYPVTIDPPSSVPVAFDTFVQTGYTSDQSGTGDLKLGYSDDGGTFVARSYLRFDTTGVWNTQIIGAQLRLWNYHSWSCVATSWEAWRTDRVDASVRIGSQPVAREKIGTSTQTKGYSSTCNDGWVLIDVGKALQSAASSRWNDVSVMLRGTSETNHLSWKRFHSAEGANPPSVSITYNAAPAAPSAISVAPCYAACEADALTSATRPTLSAKLIDGNAGQALQAEFEVRDKATGTAVAASGLRSGSPAWSNGATASWQLTTDLSNAATYQWRVRAKDPHSYGPWTGWADLTVDTGQPGVPFVSAPIYKDDGQPHGGAGQADTFTFTAASGTTDLAGFIYKLDTDSDTTTVAATGTAAVTLRPRDGQRTLTVQAKDRAGNLSEPNLYIFSAGNAALAQPLPGANVVKRAKLQITTPVTGYTRAYFEYRRGPGAPARPVPSANLTSAGGAPITATAASPVPFTTLGGHAVWNAADTLGQVGGVVEVRARIYTASSATPVYDTPWVRITVDTGGDRGADEEIGPGMVNLLTGDHGLSATDVDEMGLSVTRTASSRGTSAGYLPMPERLTANQQQVSTDLTGFTVASSSSAARSTAYGQGEETPVDSLEITPVTTTSNDTYVAVGGDSGALRLGMQAGRTYRMTGWIYVPAGTGLAPAYAARGLRVVGFYRVGGTYHEVASPMAGFTEGWQELSADMTVPAGATEAFFRLYNGAQGGSGKKVYWDNLSFTEMVAPFGPVWSTGIAGGPASATYTTLTFPEPSVAQVNTIDGGWITFSRNADGSTFTPEPGVEELTLTRTGTGTYRLTDTDGTVSEFTQQGGVWAVASTWAATGDSTTRYAYDTSGGRMLLKRVVNPAQPGVDDAGRCSGTTLPRGCQVLEYVYAPSTAPGLSDTTFGDYADRVVAVKLWTWDPAASATTAVEVARYAYDHLGRLREVWDPRVSPVLKTGYEYDAAGRVGKLTPAGELPWMFDHGNPDVDSAALRWDLDAGSGTSAADSSGGGRAGTIASGVGWGQGNDPDRADDRALTFGAASGAEVRVAGTPLSNTAAYTVSAWARLTDKSVNRTIVSKDGSSTSGFFLNYVAATDRWSFSRVTADSESSTAVRATSNVAPTLGQWTHIAGVHDPATGKMTLYVNGVAQSTTAATGGWNASGNYVIGRAKWAGAAANLWHGGIDDVRIYGRALTADQIADLAGDEHPGKLLRIRRAALQPGSKTVTSGEVATNLVYNTPLTRAAGGPYDLNATAAAAWGQSDVPTEAVAVFGPEDTPGRNSATGSVPGTAGYRYATVYYLNPHGQAVNVASPGGYIDTQEYDRFGNVVRTLEATDRSLALGLLPSASTYLAELGLLDSDTASRAYALSTANTYSSDGVDLLEAVGPTVTMVMERAVPDPDGAGRLIGVAAGSTVIGRPSMAMTYDEDKPDGARYHLVTKQTQGARIDGYPAVDLRVVATGYAAEHGGVSGWVLRRPTKTVNDAGGENHTSYRVYDDAGRVVRTLGIGADGADARTLVVAYYTAGSNSADTACGNRPEWAGQVCSTRAAGEVTGHDPARMTDDLPVRRVTAYNRYLDEAEVTETAAGKTRTTTTTYDAAARVTGRAVTSDLGTAVPATTATYDAANGRVARSAADGAAVIREYDSLGRLVSYTDADGAATVTEFDRFGKKIKVTDPTGSGTFAYDRAAEPRGMVTGYTDSVAGTFTAAYSPDGQLVKLTYPGGLTRTDQLDANLQPVSRTYTRDSDGAVVFAESVVKNSAGQWISHEYTGGSKRYSYDRVGRLTAVAADSAITAGCVTRTYAYDARSNRTARSLFQPAADGSCDTEDADASETYAYDSADRLTRDGYVYNAFGRTTQTPDGQSNGYFANDLVQSQESGDARQTWTLDPLHRLRSSQVRTQVDGAWTDSSVKVNHYGDDTDAPNWISEDGSGARTRIVTGPDDDLVAVASADGGVRLQLTNLHGDVAATIDGGLSEPELYDYEEFGEPAGGQSGQRYGWLGGKQRSGEAMGGHILMGVRLYSPDLGRFLQSDPMVDGSCNAYEYTCADPVNKIDLDGRAIPAIILAIVAAARLAWTACRVSKKWCLRALKWVGQKVVKYIGRAIAWIIGVVSRLARYSRIKNGLNCGEAFGTMFSNALGQWSSAKGYPGGARILGWIGGFIYGYARNVRCSAKTKYS
ncbi:LamG-like jellyroll fold domain-containing protein [Sphaerisporangium aureirubrum]|uniref:LamG-like jellyroll fold domain-containing protein n=1 Tax=Sphaerisporangium aureirubrum TaxID=1544736 RepID=A0ABW1NL07_9ACTN